MDLQTTHQGVPTSQNYPNVFRQHNYHGTQVETRDLAQITAPLVNDGNKNNMSQLERTNPSGY